MGCISSKRSGSSPAAVDDLEGEIRVKRSTSRRPAGPARSTSSNGTQRVFGETQSMPAKKYSSNNEGEGSVGLGDEDGNERNRKKLKGSKSKGSNSNFSLSLRFGSSKSQVVAEHTAAGWPAWLTAVAGEAIHGWVPLRADGFEKLDKVILTLHLLLLL